ncbi:histidine kinase dimerization/phosphoacceptor domain -containing protein [Halalkalibaculum sp. DA3122]
MGYVIYEISLAKQRFADQLITKSVNQTESELDNFFDRIYNLINAVDQQYDSGFWKDLPRDKTILHNISLIENYEPISSVGLADSRGYEFNVIPDTVDDQWLTRKVFVDQWGFIEKWKRWELGDSLTAIEEWEDSLAIDTRERPWYKGAKKSGEEIFWTNPYEYTTGPEIGITASQLFKSDTPDTKFKIIAFDLTLSDLNVFVDDLELTRNQNIFLLTSDNSRVIALHKLSPDLSVAQLSSKLQVSPEQLNSQELLKVLREDENHEAFNFTADGEKWWGILKPYQISETRSINIVSVLPEDDFALEITRTLWVSIGSFFLIVFLSIIVVRNHNKLHRIGNTLADKNKLVSEQKKILFSEVHHRVKNNLALISAFSELELMNIEHPLTRTYLQRSIRRIKIIAIVQEQAYKSDELGLVPSNELLSGITEYVAERSELTIENKNTGCVKININQALTYGLLLNELLFEIHGKRGDQSDTISVNANSKNGHLITEIYFPYSEELSQYSEKIKDQEIISAFLKKLSAKIETHIDDKICITLSFELKKQKGIVGSKFYNV